MAAAGTPDGLVPGYVGRVLDEDASPVGTCFQVRAGVVATAWHVLERLGKAAEGARVEIDPLGGGAACEAVVARLDQSHDLAVLTCATPLPASAGNLAASDQVEPQANVTVTGHGVIDNSRRVLRSLRTTGRWTGPVMWEDAAPAGRMTAEGLLPGMSGAPVIRDSDGAVVGVVSGRYNSRDGWLAQTVWVTRTEDLVALLGGIVDIAVLRLPLTGPVDLLLTVDDERVRLTGAGADVAAAHGGVRPGLIEAVNEARRSRGRVSLLSRTQADTPVAAGELSLARAARLVGESFLPGPAATELARILKAAEAAHQPVRLGLAVPPGLAGLPWEALPGPDGRPVTLNPLVSVYRKTAAATGRAMPGPLRIVVAIAVPDSGGGPLLDYERELRNVLAAVRSARLDAADVRVVPFATPEAIRAELAQAPAHVLHVSGHGSPGKLDLENHDGAARPVTADEFIDLAIPPGRMPPVITLSACYTAAAASQDSVSFAARLCQRGAAAVIATETSITDAYATRLLARVYDSLAKAPDGDVIAALAEARRLVQAELETATSPRDVLLAELGEWAAVTVLAATGYVPVIDPGQAVRTARQPSRPPIAGLADREDWYFVGRRAEQRRWPADLTGTGAGIVIHGMGGSGKTSLAAELVGSLRDREPGRVLVSLRGPLTLEGLLGAVITRIRRELLVSGDLGATAAIRALDVAARTDEDWRDRLGVLREQVLDRVPLLVLLDNFEDNLRPNDDDGYAITDGVLGELLAAWVASPGQARLLVTSRYPFTLPGRAERHLSFRQLGALSRAETMKLAWSLPALDHLDEAQLDQAWRLVGGHPRSLEYLDALLSGGEARYPDVTKRLNDAVTRRLEGADQATWLAAHTGLDAALAETITLAADDVLLPDLLTHLDQVPGAADLLLGISVYREPVDHNAVLFQAGQPDPAAAYVPDRKAASEQIANGLAAAGITIDGSVDLAALPGHLQVQLAPQVAEFTRQPSPPVRPSPDLPGQVAACRAASLLTTISADDGTERFFVHRWTATELSAIAGSQAGTGLTEAHRAAAAYWMWRVQAWQQDRVAYVHDLMEARHHLLQAGEVEAAGEVTLMTVCQLRDWGAWDQGASLIHDMVARLPADSHSQADLIHELGNIAYFRGDYDEAARQYQRALDIEERRDNQDGVAVNCGQLGIVAQARWDFDEAIRHHHRALDIFKRLGNQTSIAGIYHQLGNIAGFRGNYDEATGHYHGALDIFESLGDQFGRAVSYDKLGGIAHQRGDFDEATRQYQRALDIEERLGRQAAMANSYQSLGKVAQDRGDYAEATRQYQRSLDISERIGHQEGMANCYHQLGALAQVGGDYDEATRQYQRALDIFERLGRQINIAPICHQLGNIARDREDFDEARGHYHRALDAQEQLGNQAGIAINYHQLGTIAQDYDEARRLHERALDIFENLGDQASMAKVYGQLGILARRHGDYEEAGRQYQRSLDISERLGDQNGIAVTCSQLGMLEKDRNGPPGTGIALHVKAMVIRVGLGVPEAAIDLHMLAAYRSELGPEQFASLLRQSTGDPGLVEAITAMLAELDKRRE